jgi:hypothetical protein
MGKTWGGSNGCFEAPWREEERSARARSRAARLVVWALGASGVGNAWCPRRDRAGRARRRVAGPVLGAVGRVATGSWRGRAPRRGVTASWLPDGAQLGGKAGRGRREGGEMARWGPRKKEKRGERKEEARAAAGNQGAGARLGGCWAPSGP